MSATILKAIILICSATPVENKNGDWSTYKTLQQEEKECREYYYSCNPLGLIDLVECDKKRKL